MPMITRAILQVLLLYQIRGPHGEVLGVITLERRGKDQKPFTIHDRINLETLARVMSKAQSYVEKLGTPGEDGDEYIRHAAFSWARDIIAEATLVESELDTFLDVACIVSAAIMHADSSSIYLIEPDSQVLTQRAGTGTQVPSRYIRSYALCAREELDETREKVGITAYIAIANESIYSENKQQHVQHAHYRGKYDTENYDAEKEECGEFYGVPLEADGEVIGVLNIENTALLGTVRETVFSSELRKDFTVLSQDIALSIRRVHQQIDDRYAVVRHALPAISIILGESLELKRLCEQVVAKQRNSSMPQYAPFSSWKEINWFSMPALGWTPIYIVSTLCHCLMVHFP